jgi:hypothetical protein
MEELKHLALRNLSADMVESGLTREERQEFRRIRGALHIQEPQLPRMPGVRME